jgi:tricorn protease
MNPHSLRTLAAAVLFSAAQAMSAPIRLAQEPTLSPDGTVLAFAWRGDIWSVPVKGGSAKRLTQHPAIESSPAFSPDGKQIAFVSDREGTRQVYVMPAGGGEPRQVTWHSEGYKLEGWFPDGKGLLVNITRDHFWKRAERLARLDATTRKAEQVLLDDYAFDGAVSPDGKRMLFVREGEVWWRQGYEGSRAGQIWMLNLDDKSCRQLQADRTECRWPQWKPDSAGYFYVSGRAGAWNLWEHDDASGKEKQLTDFKTDSVVFPTASRDGKVIVFRHQFDFYRLRTGGNSKPEKIEIQQTGDALSPAADRLVLEKATDVAFTANGLQVAFIAGGDVWVMDTELREPRQVTRTAEEERDVVFAPDGKALWFVSDAGGQTDIWKAEPREPGKFWWENRDFKLTRITNDAAVESGLQFSPDGKHLGWIKERGDIWVADADGSNARRVAESWNKPDFEFSPDGKWIAYAVSDEWFNSDIWLLPLDGSRKPFNLSRHPNNDRGPAWSPDGKLIAWTGKREAGEVDIHYVWLRAEDSEQDKRERTLQKAIEKMTKPPTAPTARPLTKPAAPATPPPKPEADPAAEPAGTAAKDEEKKPGEKTDAQKPKPKVEVRVDFENIRERIRRIAIPNSDESGLAWSPDSKKLAFTATVEGKKGTYAVDFPGELKPKLIVPNVLAQSRWLVANDSIVCLSEGLPSAIATKSPAPAVTSYRFRAPQSVVRAEKQRAVFDTCWRIMRDHYYDEHLGGRDWNAVRAKYAGMAAEVPDMRATVEVVQLMLGELNGSHLGFTLNASTTAAATWREETAHLGLRFDASFAGPGWKVRDVLAGGPASHKRSAVQPGEIILRVDGRDVQPEMDSSEVLNGLPERDITLHVKAADGAERDITLRPIPWLTVRKLLYEQWIKECRAAAERASDSKLGYLHISAMSEESFHRFQEELFDAGDGKDGLVIDVRENGGGSTADHLLTALTQPRHAITVPRGGTPGYPQDRIVYAIWDKPIVVLCNQNSYSNAEIFSHAIKTLKRGQLVGVPTAGGVISTGTARVMDVGTLRLPSRGWHVLGDGLDMELNGAVPDHVLWPAPGELPAGKDAQLEKAVEVLKADVATWKQRPQPQLLKASERKR